MKPMPSPRGTNRAGLYLPSRGPRAAYDAANGLREDDLRDENGKLDPQKIAMLGGFMAPNVNPATRVILQMLAAAEQEGVSGTALETLRHIANSGWLHRDAKRNDKAMQRAEDGGRDYTWARDWATGKGLSEDEANEFVEGLEQHSDQPAPFAGRPTRGSTPLPLNGAEDRKRKMAADARMAASSSNRKSFDARFPDAKRLQQGSNSNDSVSALRGHMSKIGIV